MNYYHLAELVHQQAKKYGDRTALKYRDFEEKSWKNISWKRFSDKIMKTAWGMAQHGVQIQDRIGIYAQNMPQYLMVDFGAYANRAITVPIYATSSPSQVEYIVNDAQIELLFVGEQFQYNNAYIVQQTSSSLKKIIIFDPTVKLHREDTSSIYFENFISSGQNSNAEVTVNIRLQGIKETDTACIIYTSGTTGEPKGVVLPHSCFIEVFRIHDIKLFMASDKDISMCFLPLAHIFEKAWTYHALHVGITIVINQDAKEIQKSIKQVRPTIMCSVPRFWEKLYEGVSEKINNSKGILKWIYADLIKTGKKYKLEYQRKGLTPPIGIRIKYFLYRHTMCYLVKRIIGIERGNIFPCAGAPLSRSINEFLLALDIPILAGYGLTETSATVSFYPPVNYIVGSVGEVMPGLALRIGENNEIQVKGKTVMKEYYNKPEETANTFTPDGFLKTGDAGIYENGVLTLTERIKDLYKTSNGKYIAPQAIETRLGEDKYIDLIAVIGDERKFVSALIVPNYPHIEAWAGQEGIVFENRKELLENKEVYTMISQRIEQLQASFAPYEKVKKFKLLPEPFTMESGELTNTLKLKRKTIEAHYRNLIETMYAE